MERLTYKNILQKIFIFSLSVSILLTAILVGLSSYLTEELTLELVRKDSSKSVGFYADSVGNWVAQQISILETYASGPTLRSMNWNQIKPFLEKEIEKNPDLYIQFFLADPTGKYHASFKENAGSIQDREYFHRVMKGDSVFTEPLLSKTLGKLVYIVAVPIFGQNQEIIGLLGVNLNISSLNNYIKDFKVDHPHSYSYIVDQQGNTMAHLERKYVSTGNITVPSEIIPQDFAEQSFPIINNEEGSIEYSFNGIKTYAFYKKIPHTDGWTLVTRIPFSYLYEPVKEKNRKLFITGTLATLFISFGSLYLGMMASKPILSLTKALKENQKLLDSTLRHDQFKTEFFSNISHELKTPLNIIFGNIQLLELTQHRYTQGGQDSTLTKYMNVMKQNCYRLMRLIDNLIDITRIDAGFIKPHLTNHNIVEIVENITLSTVAYVENKGRTLEFDTNTEETIMACDPDKIERVMLNLLSNALKFTNYGDSIQVSLWNLGDRVAIWVKDTGIGIPKEKQQQVFDRFTQVNSSLHRNHEGSGIGLSLVKSLVEMHHGTVTVESQMGKGSTFIIELPITLVEQENTENERNTTIQQGKVERIHIEFSDIYS